MPRVDAPPARDDETPYPGTTFRVRISGTTSARRAAGLPVARVGWGPFPVAQGDLTAPPAHAGNGELPARHVLLSRGLTAATELADWWRIERAPKRSAARTVAVELVDPETGSPVLTWTFSGCRVVHLSHSHLDALVGSVVTESLLFEYGDVDIT